MSPQRSPHHDWLSVTRGDAPALRQGQELREAAVVTQPFGGFDVPIDVVAGREYRIQLAATGPYPTYQPFLLRMRAA